jgi:hypothetical protein
MNPASNFLSAQMVGSRSRGTAGKMEPAKRQAPVRQATSRKQMNEPNTKRKRMKAVRFNTLVKHCGLPFPAETLSTLDYQKAVKENRVVTIHHDDGSNRGRDFGWTGHHIVNALERIVFPKPLPVSYGTPVHAIYNYFAFQGGAQ